MTPELMGWWPGTASEIERLCFRLNVLSCIHFVLYTITKSVLALIQRNNSFFQIFDTLKDNPHFPVAPWAPGMIQWILAIVI